MGNEESKKSPDEAGNPSRKGKLGADGDKMHTPTPAGRCMKILEIGCPVVFGGIIIVSCYLFFKNSAFDWLGLFGLILAGVLALLPFILCAWNPSFLSGVLAGGLVAYHLMKHVRQESSKSDDDGPIDKTKEIGHVVKKITDLIHKGPPPSS